MSVSAARPTLEIIGREAEMALLATFLREGPGRPAALILQGEAGIGKTTILRAALDRAQPSDLRVLAIRLSGGEAELPFAALGDLIEEAGGEGLAALAPAQREAIEIALGRMGGTLNEHALARGLLSLLRGWSASGPLLLVIDDVQWLDRPTASALSFALRRIGAVGLRVNVALRSADGTPTAELPLNNRHDQLHARRPFVERFCTHQRHPEDRLDLEGRHSRTGRTGG